MVLPEGTEPSPGWLESLCAKAGVPCEVADLGAACQEASADVILITEEIAVPDGWLGQLCRRPAGLAVGTISAAAVAQRDPEALARAGAAMPKLGHAVTTDRVTGPCVLLTRDALQLVGTDGLDAADAKAFAAGFGTRAAERGLANLISDCIVVGADAEPDPDGWAATHARNWARQLTDRISVTIDARSLVGSGAGTQVHTLELIRALAGRDRLRLRVVLPPKPDPGALRELRTFDGLELKTYAEVVNAGVETDIVHRPFQVFTVHDLRLLQRLGRRIIVTQQDQLLYRNPSYFGSRDEWEDYRQVSRIALAWADRAVFFTEHARQEALRDELLDDAQSAVVAIGTDRSTGDDPEARAPRGLAGEPFLLVLGSDLAHKNRPFAIRLLRQLREHHGWQGQLVLAGPHSEHGSSRAEEEALLAGGEDAAVVLGHVDAGERRWLLEHCAAVVFPSVEEGFGLIPFEAGDAGTPCLFAHIGAMAETLPASAATLVPWDPEASARLAAPLLAPGADRDRHVALLHEASAGFRWAGTAARMEELYDDVLATAPRPVAPIVAAEVDHQREYEAFRARAGEDGMALLGPGGFLPAEMLRPLLAVASRPTLRRPFFALLRLIYKAGHRSAD